MKFTILALSSIIFLISGCNIGSEYKKFKELSPDVEWHKSLKVEFNPEIEDITVPYNIYLVLNHHTVYPYQNCSIKLTQITPSGKTYTKSHYLQIRDTNSKLIGKGAGDYWDLEEIIEQNYFFKEKGEYTYIAEHNMPRDRLTHVYRLGLVIKKVKSEN